MLLTRAFEKLTGVEEYAADPLAGLEFVAFVEEHDAGFEDGVDFDPVFETAADLEPVGQDYDALVAHDGEHVVVDALLFA